MKTIALVALLLLTASTSFAGDVVAYEKVFEDATSYGFVAKDSLHGDKIITVTTKVAIKSKSKKSSYFTQDFVINCKADTVHTEKASGYRNNIKIGYKEVSPEEDIVEGEFPAKLADLYCAEKK